MPFKSKAQLRKFAAMAARGEIGRRKFREWLNETPNIGKLPERVGSKLTAAATRAHRRKAKR
ncbi:MAG TPA: hypothetical protein EYP63_06005 [Desulfotomaculum sp.]|nr:hypothetical protein [Desulfotomaculum sp.]